MEAKPEADDAPMAEVQYTYMFEDNKRPTKQFDALLRAIARHIMTEIGDRSSPYLTPNKLATFYKAVGGDYDAIFLGMPHASISYMWQFTGCQHILVQPVKEKDEDGDPDYMVPTVPALTCRGFSRWESLDMLLGPDEHVPFLQYAVQHWNLKHPESGEAFPSDLPRTCFPAQGDSEVDEWHRWCAKRAVRETEKHAAHHEHPEVVSDPDEAVPRFAYKHIHNPNLRSDSGIPIVEEDVVRPYSHARAHSPLRHFVASTRRDRGGFMRSPATSRRTSPSKGRTQPRRQASADYPSNYNNHTPGTHHHSSAATPTSPTFIHADGGRPSYTRRYSHTGHGSGESSGDDDDDVGNDNSRMNIQHPQGRPRARTGVDLPSRSAGRKAMPHSTSQQPFFADVDEVPTLRSSHRSELRDLDNRRSRSRSTSSRRKLADRVSQFLDRDRDRDRRRPDSPDSYKASSRATRNAISSRERELDMDMSSYRRHHHPTSRMERSYSDMPPVPTPGSDDNESADEVRRRRRRARDYQHERDYFRDSTTRRQASERHAETSRDWDNDRESPRRERPRRRGTDMESSRPSSLADAERRRHDSPAYDIRDRAEHERRMRDKGSSDSQDDENGSSGGHSRRRRVQPYP